MSKGASKAKKAAIISVGTELLMGEITNTNTVFLSQKLNDLGIDVLFHHTVGDNPGRLSEVPEIARSQYSPTICRSCSSAYCRQTRSCCSMLVSFWAWEEYLA